MIFRNVLVLVFCAVAAIGIGSIYQSHAYLVWGLLFLCWACYRIKLRAESLFGNRSAVPVSASTSGGDVRMEQDSSLS